jgi:hypothetical protein
MAEGDGSTAALTTPSGIVSTPPAAGLPTPATLPSAGGAAPGDTAPKPPALLFDHLPDEMRGEAGLKKFEKADLQTFAKSYIELDKLRNDRSGVKPLTPESTPEDITAYRQAFGIPEKADEYQFSDATMQTFPEAVTPTQADLSGFRELAHQIHLTPAQLNEIMTWYGTDTAKKWEALTQQQDQANSATWETMRKKYGAQAEPLVMMAHEYLNRRWGQAGLDAFDFQPGGTKGLGASPLAIELLLENARLTGHDKFIMADGKGGGVLTKESALQRYNELWASRAGKTDAEKKVVDDEINRLGPIAFSG